MLSDIFADLLSPRGRHGQGELFLGHFLNTVELSIHSPHLSSCKVYREYATSQGRRIDIVLEFPNDSLMIGIENKPWAGEQEGQLASYIADLEEKVEHAKLLYLSGDGTAPTTLGPRKMELNKAGDFRTVPFRSASAETPLSLDKWLEACWRDCTAPQVRWFLRDCLSYIGRQFSCSANEKEEAE